MSALNPLKNFTDQEAAAAQVSNNIPLNPPFPYTREPLPLDVFGLLADPPPKLDTTASQ